MPDQAGGPAARWARGGAHCTHHEVGCLTSSASRRREALTDRARSPIATAAQCITAQFDCEICDKVLTWAVRAFEIVFEGREKQSQQLQRKSE